MERISQIIKKVQHGTSLRKSSMQSLVINENGEHSISLYTGELQPKIVAESVAKIKAAFPSLKPEYFSLFIDRLKERGFSDHRLIDSVNNVIDNCQYSTPTLANFLSFDKRVKIYNYHEMCNVVSNNRLEPNYFSKIRINGKLFWIKTSDKDLYQLPDEF